MAEKVNRREQVKELIEAGQWTKAGIAEQLGVKTSSVSSQMTYLRWMGFFIIADEEKVLHFCTEVEAAAHQEKLSAKRKTKSTTTRTPLEQAEAIAKTIKSQKAALKKWTEKVTLIKADLDSAPDDDDLTDLRDEAEANITLLGIKLKRNTQKALDLPTPEEKSSTTPEDGSDGSDGSDRMNSEDGPNTPSEDEFELL